MKRLLWLLFIPALALAQTAAQYPVSGLSAYAAPIGATTFTPSLNYVHGVTTLCETGVAQTSGTNTGETNLATCTIPAGLMGANSGLIVLIQYSMTSDTTQKTETLRWGTTQGTPGSAFSTGSVIGTTTNLTNSTNTASALVMIGNANATNAQVYNPAQFTPFSAGQNGSQTSSVNTALVSYLNVDCTDSVGTTSTCGILHLTVLMISP